MDYNVIQTGSIIKDKIIVLANLSIFVKLWEADVTQSHDVSCLKVTGQCLDCFVGGEFIENCSLWQA